MMKLFYSVTVIGSLLVAAFLQGCSSGSTADSQSQTAAESPADREYNVRGIVRQIGAGGETLTITHEDIPGFMPSMTMPFYIKDPSHLPELNPGDGVAFRFVLTSKDSWATDFQKIDAAQVKLPEPKPVAKDLPHNRNRQVSRVDEGDRVPELDLIDANGDAFSYERFQGKPLLLTFIFTRCPVPNFCPLMNQNFKSIDETVQSDAALQGEVNLLSVTIDPEHDTPEVLKKHRTSVAGESNENWTFATGQPKAIEKLTRAFSVYIGEEEETLNHGLCTALIGPEGVIQKIWRGNRWKPSEVVSVLRGQSADTSQTLSRNQ